MRMYVTIRFTPQNLIVKWPFSLNLFANLMNSLNYPPPVRLIDIKQGNISYFFGKEVTIKRKISVCVRGEKRDFLIAV